jgi:hypothetical protein
VYLFVERRFILPSPNSSNLKQDTSDYNMLLDKIIHRGGKSTYNIEICHQEVLYIHYNSSNQPLLKRDSKQFDVLN